MAVKIYVIGSLRNASVPLLGNRLRELGYTVFDDWHGAGPEADDYWQKYEETRGRRYKEALHGYAATNIFEFDKRHLDESDMGILVLPCGRSGHLELGYLVGQGKPTFVLFNEEPERWDLMYRLASSVHYDIDSLVHTIQEEVT